MANLLRLIAPAPPKIPGVDGVPDDAEWQFVEKSVMDAFEYLDIAAKGAIRWTLDKIRQSRPEMQGPLGLLRELDQVFSDILRIARSARTWRKRGLELLVAANLVFTPMEWISMMLRSFNDFVFDLFRHPEGIKIASKALAPPLRMIGMAGVTMTGVRRVFMGGTRTSASAISPKQFEELALPEWQETSEYFDRGCARPWGRSGGLPAWSCPGPRLSCRRRTRAP